MKQLPDNSTGHRAPLSSPHPALQALLPRLGSIGVHSDERPLFDEPDEVSEYLDERGLEQDYQVVAVWAINHADLMRSDIVHWTYSPWLD